jgi:hypothetical protein
MTCASLRFACRIKLEAANILPAIFFPVGVLPLVNFLLGLFK